MTNDLQNELLLSMDAKLDKLSEQVGGLDVRLALVEHADASQKIRREERRATIIAIATAASAVAAVIAVAVVHP